MNENTIYQLLADAFMLALKLSAPTLLLGMLIGIIISMFQTATSIQEQTLTFIPKLLITAITLILTAPWMIKEMMIFTLRLMAHLEQFAR